MEEQANNQEKQQKSCKNLCGLIASDTSEGLCAHCYDEYLDDIKTETDEAAAAAAVAAAIRPANKSPVARQTQSATECTTMSSQRTVATSTSDDAQQVLRQTNRMSPTLVKTISEMTCKIRSESSPIKSVEVVSPVGAINTTGISGGFSESLKDVQITEVSASSVNSHQVLSTLLCQTKSESPNTINENNLSPLENNEANKGKSKRCYVCRRKLGLTGFNCRCGGQFCGMHRYSDKHDCSFDYKEYGKSQIRRNNPIVSGEKISKI